MSKNNKDIAIEALLEREKTKNRRIITAVLIAVGIMVGIVIGHFGSVEITNQMRSNFTAEVQTLSKVQK